MSIAIASDLEIAPARPLLMPLVSAVACVALAGAPPGALRTWRMERYLANNPDPRPNLSDSSKG
jgi:hypothetical protein